MRANFALIYTALSTLHGEEVENSYDASQIYNQRIAAARAQDQLGWKVDVTTRQENGGVRVVADFRDRDGADRAGPRGQRQVHAPDRPRSRTAMRRSPTTAASTKVSRRTFIAGKWTLDLEAKLNGERKFFSENKLELKANAE